VRIVIRWTGILLLIFAGIILVASLATVGLGGSAGTAALVRLIAYTAVGVFLLLISSRMS
jgi:hypothetical protein